MRPGVKFMAMPRPLPPPAPAPKTMPGRPLRDRRLVSAGVMMDDASEEEEEEELEELKDAALVEVPEELLRVRGGPASPAPLVMLATDDPAPAPPAAPLVLELEASRSSALSIALEEERVCKGWLIGVGESGNALDLLLRFTPRTVDEAAEVE